MKKSGNGAGIAGRMRPGARQNPAEMKRWQIFSVTDPPFSAFDRRAWVHPLTATLPFMGPTHDTFGSTMAVSVPCHLTRINKY